MAEQRIILTESTRRAKEEELRRLRTEERPRVTEDIRRAREYGDLSENFEYHAARNAQAILNGRIAELEALLERAVTVPDAEVSTDRAGIGTVVRLFDRDGNEEFEVVIVDAASADPANDRISYQSPIGMALQDRSVGEVVKAQLPNSEVEFEILEIRLA